MQVSWNETFINHAVDIARIYKEYPEKIMICMGFNSMVECLNECYTLLVRTKELEPIEKLEPKEKTKYWETSAKYAEVREHRIKISRSIYLLDKLTK